MVTFAQARTVSAVVAATLLIAGCAGSSQQAAQTVTATATMTVPVERTVTVTWTPPPPPGPAVRLDGGEGIYVVGTDITPGRWRTVGGQGRCYWARLGDLIGDDILDNNNSDGPQVVDILPSDAAFELRHCGPWFMEGSERAGW